MTAVPPAPDKAALALLDPDGRFLDRLRQDRAALAELLRALRKDDGEGKAILAALETLAHRLAGAAGTFGYGAIGDAAMELEDWLTEAEDTAPCDFPGMVTDKAARLAALLDDAVGER